MSACLRNAYTVAMVLNNIGISLLQRGANDQALQAMSFAINLVREISKSPALELGLSPALIEEMVNNANRNLAMCQNTDSSNVHEVNAESVFRVITHEDIHTFTKKSLEASVENQATPVLIRMELSATSISEMTTYYPAIESSILLHNLGTAYMGLALTEESTEMALEKRRCSYGLFQLSFHILETLYQAPFLQNHDDLSTKLLPTLILTLQSLTSATSVLGLVSESVNFNSHFLSLCPKLYSVLYDISNLDSAPAKAA